MTLFLRRSKTETIVDIELWVKTEGTKKFIELHPVVCIEPYSKFLLDNIVKADEIIEDFSVIADLRGWLWESYFSGEENDANRYKDVLFQVKVMLQNLASKYGLFYVEG